jgi:tetratricopeptide (TPR) repeat protein
MAGEQLIERHDETGAGSGGHEEAYIVVSGHARFTVDERQIDAPAGTIVFVPDVGSCRSAVALASDTTAIVVGAPADHPLPVSPFEYWFVAEEPYKRGDYHAAIEIVSEGLEQWPDHRDLHYQLACYHALAGENDRALAHLERAAAADESVREWAAADEDFSTIRSEPRFGALTSPPSRSG